MTAPQQSTHPLTIHLTLPEDITMAESQHMAANIISAAPSCEITVDTRGMNQGIAELLQEQYPEIRLAIIST